MKTILIAILLMPILAAAQGTIPFTPAVIFNGDTVRTLRSQVDINGIASLRTGADNPTVVAVSAPQGSLYLRTGASGGQLFIKQDSGNTTNWLMMGAGGSVSSVGLSLPAIFTVSGSPVTTSGTLSASLADQAANFVWSGPSSGPNAPPTFRALVSLDIPNLNASKITSGQGTLSTSTPGVSIGSGINSLLSSATVDVQTASGSQPGLLSAADWTTFNNKVSAARAINTTAPLAGGGDLSADRTLSITQSGSGSDGYLSSGDWTTFNAKQSAGNYITALTGDVTASGPGSSAAAVVKIQGVAISSTPPTAGQVLTYNGTSTQWDPKTSSNGALVANGSGASPITITAAGGITATTEQRQLWYTVSVSGAVSITANPQISAGLTVGQELAVYGTSSANYIILADGTGLSLNGPINLTDNSAIILVWNGTIWSELSRR